MDLTIMKRALQGARRDAKALIAPQHLDTYSGSRFGEVWDAVMSDPYAERPEQRIELHHALRWDALQAIYKAARRTLVKQDDLLPPFDKLVHPVGICLRGTWRITEHSRYTGYFRKGSEGLVIARASDNMGENRPGHVRFLGIAGKLYPTRDPNHIELLRPANFVMNESLMGSHTARFLDATLSTDLLPLRVHGDVRLKHALGALVAAIFAAADRISDATQSLIRQVYPIAELGEAHPEQAIAPAVMRFVGSPFNRRVDTPELREELAMRYHPAGIRYEIHVSDQRSYFVPHGFRRIGEVHFTESVLSCTCDHRLHFRHAPYRHEPPRGAP